MSKPATNPFMMVDFPRLMDSSKTFGEFKLPGLDVQALMEMQRKNIAAITDVNKSIFENLQALAQRQSKSIQEGLEEATYLMGSMMSSPMSQGKAGSRADSSKIAVEKCMANMRDTAETLAQCNSQVMEKLGARFSEGLEEFSGLMKAKSATS